MNLRVSSYDSTQDERHVLLCEDFLDSNLHIAQNMMPLKVDLSNAFSLNNFSRAFLSDSPLEVCTSALEP